MDRLLRAAFILVFMVLLTGCPVSETVSIYNNSGVEVVVGLEDRDFRWLPNEKIKISERKKPISWEELEWRGDPNIRYSPFLNLQFGNEKKTFELVFPDLPGGYVNQGAYLLQFDSDGSLYIVPADAVLPVMGVSRKIRIESLMRKR